MQSTETLPIILVTFIFLAREDAYDNIQSSSTTLLMPFVIVIGALDLIPEKNLTVSALIAAFTTSLESLAPLIVPKFPGLEIVIVLAAAHLRFIVLAAGAVSQFITMSQFAVILPVVRVPPVKVTVKSPLGSVTAFSLSIVGI